MNLFRRKDENRQGTTLIEVLVSIAVVSFLSTTIYLTLTGAVSNMGESKQRVGAVAIANEKMEVIRNLDYEEVGIIDGMISGPMLALETVTRNGFDFDVYIDVRYVDDPLDGVDPDDLISTDYKLVQVVVEWEHQEKIDSVEFVSSFVPDGVETNMGGGTLVLNTMTSGGELVANVNVHLESIEDSPVVDYFTTTDFFGSLVLQGVPSQTYRISLSKTDYESVRTYPNPPESSFIPVNIDFYVDEGALNSKNFFIDLASDLVLKAINVADESGISGVDVELEGGKEIGSEPTTYNLNDTSTTDSNGEIDYDDISLGSYEITNFEELGTSVYKFIGSEEDATFDLVAGIDEEIELLFADENISSLYVTVLDDVTEELIQGVEVGLLGPLEFDQGSETQEDGTVFFPLTVDPPVLMENDEYAIEARINGYEDYVSTVDISDFTTKEVRLTPL
ncbi:MAG: hypothetical protein KAQ63_02035 [Candidatus Moranbacteria bacterium]|nr:hypothetical protein [Candidatus Moranbacteria bacterium]